MLDGYKKAAAIDVLVRAEGYASAFRRFSGNEKEALQASGAEFKLSRGREVRLILIREEGITIPADLLPQVYFADLAWRVESMWQPQNQRIEQSDFNMLGVRPVLDKPGVFKFRVTENQPPFVVGIHRSGVSQNFRAGPFTAENFGSGEMKLPIGRQSSLTASLTWGDINKDTLPFTAVHYELMRQINPGGDSYTTVSSADRTLDDTSFRADELAPGHYMLMLYTKPKTESGPTSDEVNPGRFADRKTFDIVPGQKIKAVSTYEPFNPGAYRGQRTARVKIIDINGQPAAGKTLAVSYYDGHFGQLNVFEGKIPADGVVLLTNITDRARDDIPFGPYGATVDGERIGFFRVEATEKLQDFSFHLVPQVGNAAPEIELLDLHSKQLLKLSGLRGKLVYLEFWDTGCGPCQGELEKLNELVCANGDKWQKDVVVLSLATDAEQQIISDHVRRKGWTHLRHYWSQHKDGSYFADAATAYVVHAVPTAVFIDRDGKILYRGHPASFDLAAEISKRTSK